MSSGANSLRVKSLDSIGQYGALEFRRVFPLSCSNDALIDAFAAACGHNEFVITQRTNEKASAIRELHNLFGCVLPGLPMFGPMSSRDVVVNLVITLHDKHGYKLLTVVGPKRPVMQSFVRSLEHELSSASHFWVTKFSEPVLKDLKVSFQESLDSSPMIRSTAESGNQSYKTEEAAYQYFVRILTDTRYSPAVDLESFLSDFKSSSKSDVAPSEYAKILVTKVDTVVERLHASYGALQNPSSALGDDLLPRMPASVERFVFQAAGRVLWQKYREAFADDDAAFVLKAQAIRAANGRQLAGACGVRADFRFSFAYSIGLLNSLQRSVEWSPAVLPNVLLQNLMSVNGSLKLEVLQSSHGQKQLESMDDIMPIFLFVLLAAEEVTTPHALFHFLLDTMREELRVETEGRVVALLEGATGLVIRNWALEAPDPPPSVIGQPDSSNSDDILSS